MSTSDKDINRLTGKLLKEGMVKPSPDLSLRIMELIMQEEPLKVPEVKKARMSSGMPPFMIVGIIIAYLVVFAGVLMLLGQQPAGSVDHMLEGIKYWHCDFDIIRLELFILTSCNCFPS